MKKFLFFFLCFLIVALTCVSATLYVKVVDAADAIPDPMVPCSDEPVNGNASWEDPEFNSLRPYQASPCGDAPFATMCGNTLKILLGEVETDYCGSQWCGYDGGPETKDVVVDLSGVELPFLGNTELTANSQNATDQIGDDQKVNEYVSWYLAGTNQKAEYGPDTINKIVNLSGPSKKLNPAVIQELNRFRSLHNAGVKPERTLDSDDIEPGTEDINPAQEGVQARETDNHNQIVVCTEKNILGITIPNWIPWVGSDKPAPCYSGNGQKTSGTVYRLLNWWNGKATDLGALFDVIPGWNNLSAWSSTTPPFPWQFEKDIYYKKAYNEWRGKTCVILFERLSCIGGSFSPSADFYQYIPLSNTADKRGKEWFDHVPLNAPRATFVGRPELNTVINAVPKLYYPHTTEVNEALEQLNATHLPHEGVDPKETFADTEDNTTACKIVEVRTNDGDALTFDNTTEKHQVNFTVTYEIDQIECRENGQRRVNDPITGFFSHYETIWDCSSDVYATVGLTTFAPELKNIWQNSVAGAGSSFRRIFPKVEEGAPVSCIADMPGTSPANYNLNGASDSSVRLLNVLNPGGSPSSNPEIYFPHLGSVYEYFLKGIQTALRPEGFGEPIPDGEFCLTGTNQGDCSFNLQAAYAAIDRVAAKYNIAPELMRTIFEIESGPYIADPASYQCTENSAGAAGIAQIKRSTYEVVTCANEELANDIGVCTDPRDGKLSRCSTEGAIELMARILLFSAGKWMYGPNTCQAAPGGLPLSNKIVWYNAACNYGTGFEPNTVTINYQNSLAANERPVGRDMNYCDVVCHMMGQCPSYPAN